MAKILVVEDNPETLQSIKTIMHAERHATDCAVDGEEAWDFIKTYEYDLFIFDWEMPKISGVELVRRYRAEGGKTPVIMLTGKTATPDKIEGLDSGADNYLTKPFGSEELLSFVRATLRRAPQSASKQIVFSDLTIDLASSTVRCGETTVNLSSREVTVLKMLIESKNTIVSHDQLKLSAWADAPDVSQNTVRVFLASLREKLNSIGSSLKIINARGYGYQLKS